MKRPIFGALAFLCGLSPAQAQTLSADDLARRTIERRAVEAIDLGIYRRREVADVEILLR